MPELDTAGTEVDLMVLDGDGVPSAVMTITGMGMPASSGTIEDIVAAVEDVEGLSVQRRGAGGVTHD